MKAKPGLIVYFDGPDGVGKTTQLKLAAEKLREGHQPVHVTRTLGGTHIGEMLREVMLSRTARPVETDLHIALASQYALAEDLQSRREGGELILIDRSPLSILAYQVYGDKLDHQIGYDAIRELLELIKPDLLITYLASDTVIAKRRSHRHRELSDDFFENKSLVYHKRVTRGFREASAHFNTSVVDASQSIQEVHCPVIIDGDMRRDHLALHILGGIIKRLDKIHHVNAVLAERAAHRRRRAGLAAPDLHL